MCLSERVDDLYLSIRLAAQTKFHFSFEHAGESQPWAQLAAQSISAIRVPEKLLWKTN